MKRLMLAWLLVLAACGGDDKKPCTETGTCEEGARCASDGDCESGMCRWLDARSCVSACTKTTDCPEGLVCGVDPENRDVRSCQEPCSSGDSTHQVACVEGIATLCEDIEPGQHCWSCDCPEGSYCPNGADPEGDDAVCRPKRAHGESCYDGRYCSSGNCSSVVDYKASEEPGTCIAAHGTACENECTYCAELLPDEFACIAQCTPTYDACPADTKCTNFGDERGGRCLSTCTVLQTGDTCASSTLVCWTSEGSANGVCAPR